METYIYSRKRYGDKSTITLDKLSVLANVKIVPPVNVAPDTTPSEPPVPPVLIKLPLYWNTTASFAVNVVNTGFDISPTVVASSESNAPSIEVDR